jgi:transglutaminase-like putative cysteine protease
VRLDVRYRTEFHYSEATSESQNELRACPVTDECQRLLDYRVTVTPSSRVFSYLDSWGTRVDTFGIRKPHERMTVTAEASVETRPRPLPTAAPRTEALHRDDFIDAHVEYLQRDRHTDHGPGVETAASRQAELAGPDVVGAVLSIHRFVGTHLRYEPGSTDVGIEVEDVLAGGRGVCQDFAHLAVSMCRSIGIPARYVSGYLFTERDDVGAAPTADRVVVQTHAWMEAAVPGWGWLALDPTNGQVVGEHHVKIGHGRSYDDVQPLRGVYLGPAASSVAPEVEIRRVDGADLWRTSATDVPGVGGPAGFTSGAARRPPAPAGSTIRQQQQQQQQQHVDRRSRRPARWPGRRSPTPE